MGPPLLPSPPHTLPQLTAEQPLSLHPGFLQRSWTPAPAVQGGHNCKYSYSYPSQPGCNHQKEEEEPGESQTHNGTNLKASNANFFLFHSLDFHSSSTIAAEVTQEYL